MLLPLLVALLATTNPETISANDMRMAAGKLSKGVLTLQLEARMGHWYPNGPDGMMRPVAAFAEAGGGLQNPGPLMRVPVGTQVRVTLHNRLEKTLWIYGLGVQRGVSRDSVGIAANASHEFVFTAQQPGIFYYAGKTSEATLLTRFFEDSQLNGMIVIDPPGPKPKDDLFLISWWGDEDTTKVSGLEEGATMVINGLEFPHTRKLEATQGDELTWHWVSTTIVPHPLHLHGFYFDVLAKGTDSTYVPFPAGQARKAVTDVVLGGTTMSMRWSPNRPGNWIFHCHFAGHMTAMEGLNKDRRHPAPGVTHDHKSSGSHHSLMGGLVMTITVKPNGAMKASGDPARTIRLLARSQPNVYGEYAGYGYVLGGSADEANPKTLKVPGPLLVLEKDQPVAINIINQTYEPAAVHWHGIELESFPDGVPGISGYGSNVLPAIMPGDSLTVRFTPPRAGTFMYHSHSNELQQIGSGMFGAIVVLEPGRKFDTEHDRVFVFGDNGPVVNVIKGPFPVMTLNGSTQPPAVEMKTGETYRFRMINIRAEGGVMGNLFDGEQPVPWKLVARDGADLPPALMAATPAPLVFASGQIFDYEFTPARPGKLQFRFQNPPGAPNPQEPMLVEVNVR